ncbi:MAG: glycosyltransferase [Hyphomicrobiales bacterium]|nr:glycosyltransferase [Hyphomicrobiales bacterium]
MPMLDKPRKLDHSEGMAPRKKPATKTRVVSRLKRSSSRQKVMKPSSCATLQPVHAGWISPHLLLLQLPTPLITPVGIPGVLCSLDVPKTSGVWFAAEVGGMALGLVVFKDGVEEDDLPVYTLYIECSEPLTLVVPSYRQNTQDMTFLFRLQKGLGVRQQLQIGKWLGRVLLDARTDHCDKSRIIAFFEQFQLFSLVEPHALQDPQQPFAMVVAQAHVVDNRWLFIAGWMRDPLGQFVSAEAVTLPGLRFALKDGFFRFPCPEKERENFANAAITAPEGVEGFVVVAPIPEEAENRLNNKALLRLCRVKVMLKGGVSLLLTAKETVPDIYRLRSMILESVPARWLKGPLMQKAMMPLLCHLQQHIARRPKVKDIHVFGVQNPAPEISVIVPLYHNYDFIQLQSVLFASDPVFKSQAELIYVLDAPEDVENVQTQLDAYEKLYGLPSKLVMMKENSGYATACNTGAKYARAEALVFLNSDCYPVAAGWLETLYRMHHARKNTGVTGVKLLFEDDTIQHAGIYFARNEEKQILGAHCYEGLPADHPPACESREILAVTGACFMISRTMFREVGGFSTEYIIGDFEDIDLCLKAQHHGGSNWYAAEVTMRHFQRQSMPHHGRYGGAAWRYNVALHMRRWGAFLQTQLQEKDAHGKASVTAKSPARRKKRVTQAA